MTGCPRLSLVVAMDDHGVIGRAGGLPWRLPADLRHFRSVTMGKPVVMGRRTHVSIGRPLPGRENIVLTRNRSYHADGCRVFHTLDEVLGLDAPEIMIVGGASLYADCLPHAQRLYLTEIHATVAGDTYFPRYDRLQWQECARSPHRADAHNAHDYTFVVLDRIVADARA